MGVNLEKGSSPSALLSGVVVRGGAGGCFSSLGVGVEVREDEEEVSWLVGGNTSRLRTEVPRDVVKVAIRQNESVEP